MAHHMGRGGRGGRENLKRQGGAQPVQARPVEPGMQVLQACSSFSASVASQARSDLKNTVVAQGLPSGKSA
jgi:hypothetical protein